jgi:hypothetical protein
MPPASAMPAREAGPGIYGAFSWFWTLSPLDLCRSPMVSTVWSLDAEEAQPSHHPGRKEFDSLDERKGSGSSSLCQMLFSFP